MPLSLKLLQRALIQTFAVRYPGLIDAHPVACGAVRILVDLALVYHQQGVQSAEAGGLGGQQGVLINVKARVYGGVEQASPGFEKRRI